MSCPCGKGLALESCCGPYLTGALPAPTAEALMRSRYAAFVTRNAPYLLATHDPETRGSTSLAELEGSFRGTEWLGLEVRSARGGPGDEEGEVEFVARYRAGGRPGELHERSRFRRLDDGRWVYIDGAVERAAAQVGRNDPCPCGSGQKFKKCHGR